jgi:hypothetical protein
MWSLQNSFSFSDSAHRTAKPDKVCLQPAQFRDGLCSMLTSVRGNRCSRRHVLPFGQPDALLVCRGAGTARSGGDATMHLQWTVAGRRADGAATGGGREGSTRLAVASGTCRRCSPRCSSVVTGSQPGRTFPRPRIGSCEL